MDRYLEKAISFGTLEDEHLAEAFCALLDNLVCDGLIPESLQGDVDYILERLEHLRMGEPITLDFDEEDTYSYLLEDVERILEDLSPEGYWFGSNVFEPTTFGYWKAEEVTFF